MTYRRAAGITRGWVTWGDMFRGDPGIGTELKLPATVTEYVMPGLSYTPELSVNGIKQVPGDYGPQLQMGSRKYVKGRARAEVWNVSVATPRVSSMLNDRGYADVFAMDPFALAAGYYQWERPKGSLIARQGSRVLARTTKFGEFGFRISGARKRHRLTMNLQRVGTGILLSDRATVDWWFTPGRSRVGKPLALMGIHVYGQGLDEANTAKAGSTIEFPVAVRRQPGAPTAKVTKIVAEVSFDRGRTWRRVGLRGGQAGGSPRSGIQRPPVRYPCVRAPWTPLEIRSGRPSTGRTRSSRSP